MQPDQQATRDNLKRRPEWVMPEIVDWDDLGPQFFEAWGRPRGKAEPEHVTIYGPSGSGKTYCLTYLMTMRARLRGTHAVVIATKQADETLVEAGWPIIDDWPPDYGQNQVIWWARGGLSDEQKAEQKRRVAHMLATLWQRDANKLMASRCHTSAWTSGRTAMSPRSTGRAGRTASATWPAYSGRPG